MVMKPKDRTNFLISGIFVSLGIVIVAVSIFLLSSENSIFSSKTHLYVVVKNAQNLKMGAAVQLKGIRIGSITELIFEDVDSLKVKMSVKSEYQPWIRKDSYVSFKTQGLLGDRFLEILGGTEDSEPIEDGMTLDIKENNLIDKFVNKGEDILVVAGRVLNKIDVILGSVENNHISNILVNIDKSTERTNKLLEDIDTKVLADAINNLAKGSEDLKSSSEAVATILNRVENGPGTLHSLIYDRSVHDDLRALLGGSKRSSILKYFIRESIRKAND